MAETYFDLLQKQEPLHEDLKFYVADAPGLGKVLRHPLVYSVPYHEQLNAMVNHQYEVKKAARNDAYDNREFAKYIFLHERPYRVQAFKRIADHLADHDYWEYLGHLWTDSENIRQERGLWNDLWRSSRPGRQHAMDISEQKTLAGMPDLITIYRGTSSRQGARGLSWTIDQNRAHWFGNRFALFGSRPIYYVATGKIEKRQALAYFDRESEIVAFPDRIRNISLTRHDRNDRSNRG